MKKVTHEEKLMIVTASVASQVLHECLDDLEHTSFYRQTLKQASKKMQDELTKACDPQTNHLWNTSEEDMQAIQKGILEISKVIAQADPVVIVAMGNFLKKNKINK